MRTRNIFSYNLNETYKKGGLKLEESLKPKEGYGDFIKKHRIASGYKSQRQLALASGVSAPTISRMEKEIQKRLVETLKELAPYLKTTNLFELMAICDYWDNEEVPREVDHLFISESSFDVDSYLSDSKTKTPSNEEAFVHNIDLADSDILNKFKLELDGKELTVEEAKTIISYVRFLRSQNS